MKKIAILLVNLGSPKSTSVSDVKDYLHQFLSDQRVIEANPLMWKFILNCFILPFRPKQSAEKYKQIWLANNQSPLIFYTQQQTKLLQNLLNNFDSNNNYKFYVDYAMRYGDIELSISKKLDNLQQQQYENIIVIPLYPQYSATTTATVTDEVFRWLLTIRNQPKINYIKDFFDNENYINLLASNIKNHWKNNTKNSTLSPFLVISFHGIPQKYSDAGDPYYNQCIKTANLLIEKLNLSINKNSKITFQSQFGNDPWLQPYTIDSVKELALQGHKRVDVICPGFVADCLETLEEINMENRYEFLANGGQEFNYIPAFNESEAFAEILKELVIKEIK